MLRRIIALVGLSMFLVAAALLFLTWGRPPRDRPVAAPSAPDATREVRLAEVIERVRGSAVALEYGPGDASGARRVASGVVVNEQGDVISVHVDPATDRDRSTILARDAAGHRHPARWVAADPETGLTLLRLQSDDIRPIRPSARAAVLGAAVFLIGNPYGLAHSVSRGHVAGLGRHVEVGPRPLGGLIQIQAPLHPGDSGALLADLDGGWLGLIRGGLAAPGAGAGPSRDYDLGFAIPAVDALWVADQLRAHGKVARAYLGVWPAPDSAEVGPVPGAEVAGVVPGSPAERAGLLRGDRVTRLDGRPIRTFDDLTDRLDRTPAGVEVALEYTRAGIRNRLTVRTVDRSVEPPPPATPAPAPAPASSTASPPAPSPTESTVSREILERLERLERRVEGREHREKTAVTP